MELSSSDWIAISAVVIAIVSISVSFWQGHLARKHNILSVKPHLSFDWRLRSDEDVGCAIKNDGLGPAFITDFKIKVSEDLYLIDDLFKLLEIFDQEQFQSKTVNITFGILTSEATISANSIHDLVYFVGTANNPLAQSEITNSLRDITFIFDYTCIYGKKYTQIGRVPI